VSSSTTDGLFGSAYAGIQTPPTAYLAYFGAASNWQPTNDTTVANVSAAAAFAGKVFISLFEVEPGTNSTFQTILLRDFVWAISNSSTGNAGLNSVTFQGALPNSTLTATVTYVVSDVLGVLDVAGSGVITPKSLLGIITINNFPLINATNQVQMNIGAATGVYTQGTFETLEYVESGYQSTGSYCSVDSQASVNGRTTIVQLTSFLDAQIIEEFDNENLLNQNLDLYGQLAAFTVVTVSFPVGATSMQFNAAIGAGAPPPIIPSTSVGEKIVPSLFLVMFTTIFKLLF